MRAVYLVASLIGGLLSATSVPASEPVARLKQIQGSVLINTADTYKSASEGMNLRVGDRLMSMDDGAMVLEYKDGCVEKYKENQIVSVTATSTCKGGAAYVEQQWPQQADPMVAEARRPAQGAYGYDYGYEGPSGTSTAAYVGGGILLFGLGYYIADDGDDPISGY